MKGLRPDIRVDFRQREAGPRTDRWNFRIHTLLYAIAHMAGCLEDGGRASYKVDLQTAVLQMDDEELAGALDAHERKFCELVCILREADSRDGLRVVLYTLECPAIFCIMAMSAPASSKLEMRVPQLSKDNRARDAPFLVRKNLSNGCKLLYENEPSHNSERLNWD